VKVTRFPIVPIRPLSHTSKIFPKEHRGLRLVEPARDDFLSGE